MSQKIMMNYRIDSAVIDIDSIEDQDTKLSIEEIIELHKSGEHDEANNNRLPAMYFEFNAENMDSDCDVWMNESSIYFDIDFSNTNHTVSTTYEDDQLKLSASVTFEVELKEGVNPEEFQEWLDENGGWAACSISGEWSYTEDDGGSFTIS
jgi:hypothetical protein